MNAIPLASRLARIGEVREQSVDGEWNRGQVFLVPCTYDNLDRLSSVTRGTNAFAYAYDPASNLTTRTYPGAVSTTYTYDALNRLATAVNASLTTSYAYDVASNLTQTNLPSANGTVDTRVYDNAGRLIEVKNQKGAQLRSRFLITLDPLSNPTRIERTGSLVQTQTYSYDANDRIATVCFAASCTPTAPERIAWTYDRVGNRLTETRSTGTTNYAYDARDRLLSAGATSYTYDQNGNELTATGSTFTYDLANRLKSAIQGTTTTTYSYDADGKRLQASTGTANSAKTNFLWDVSHGLPQLAQERNGANTLQRQYIYGIRRIRQSQGTGTYYLYDGLGSVANTLAPAGALQKTLSYEPYGAIRTTSGSSPTNFFHFTGEYLDPTGLYHLRARQYDSGNGRLLSVDPLEPLRSRPLLSSYAYADDRPTVFVDPSGEGAIAANTDIQSYAREASSAAALENVTVGATKHPLPRSRRFYTYSRSGATNFDAIVPGVPPRRIYRGTIHFRFTAGLNGQQLRVFTGARQIRGKAALIATVELRCGRSSTESDSSCFNDSAVQNLVNRQVKLSTYYAGFDKEYEPSLHWDVREQGVRSIGPGITLNLPKVYCGKRLIPKCYFFND